MTKLNASMPCANSCDDLLVCIIDDLILLNALFIEMENRVDTSSYNTAQPTSRPVEG